MRPDSPLYVDPRGYASISAMSYSPLAAVPTITEVVVSVADSAGEIWEIHVDNPSDVVVAQKYPDLDHEDYYPYNSGTFLRGRPMDALVLTIGHPKKYTLTKGNLPDVRVTTADAARVYAEEHMPNPDAVDIALDDLESRLVQAYLAGRSSRA